MRIIDELHLQSPYACSRMLRILLNLIDIWVGRRRKRTLMQRMVIDALYRKPNTSKKHPGHAVNPYLLSRSRLFGERYKERTCSSYYNCTGKSQRTIGRHARVFRIVGD
jgi:hypothetical protein